MCVIIVKNPDIELPYNKLSNALQVNDDGYGISIIDRGKLETIRGVHGDKVDVDKVYKAIDELKSYPMFLHMRFRTSGGYDERACHPFDVFTKADDGVDIKFMHNGVMSKFEVNNSPYPDSYFFVQKIVRPLMSKLVKAHDGDYDAVLEDDLFAEILREYSNGANRFVTYSESGKFLITNKKDGIEFDGWWASNNHYFHGRSYNNNNRGYYSSYQGQSGIPFMEAPGTTTTSGTSGQKTQQSESNSSTNVTTLTGSALTPLPKTPSSTSDGAAGYASSEDGKAVGEVIRNTRTSAIPPNIVPPISRETFVELTGLTSLHEAACLDWESLEEMVTQFPELATVLLADLLYELYLRNPSGRTN